MHSFWIYPTRENTASPSKLLFSFPDAAQRRQADFRSLGWERRKALAERASGWPDRAPLPGIAPTGTLMGFSVYRVEILDAEGVQTDPVFAPLPTTINLFLPCWSCSVEPEIWKNLTRSGFRHRKTLFKVNTGIPPSSCRNVEPAGSALSSFSEKPLLKPNQGPALGSPHTQWGAQLELGDPLHSLQAKANSASDLEKQRGEA